MADQIENYLIRAYTGLVMNKAEQSASLLTEFCSVRDNIQGSAASFGYLGDMELVAKGSRNAPTPSNEIVHRQYWANLAPYHGAFQLDETDEKAAFTDPKSDYVAKGAAAIGRKWDAIIVAAATADATYGEDKGSSEDWSAFTDRNSKSHVIAATGGVPNLADILKIRRVFAECEVTDNLVAVVSPQFMEKFLNIAEVKSSDFNSNKVLMEGRLGYYMGFNWIISNRLGLSKTTRSCLFFQKGVMGLARSINKKVRVSERDDLSYAWQAYFEISGGAVRRDPERMIEYTFTES